MCNDCKGIIAMPSPKSSNAPTFNGKVSELVDFLELFDAFATSCDLTSAEKCKCLVRYTDLPTKRFWVCLDGYESRDFDVFKKCILSHYPGAENGLHYSIRDLERIVVNTANSDISTEDELQGYYHEFYPVAYWLVRNNKLTQYERDRYFWKGLPLPTRRAIDQWLIGRDVDYNRNEATDFEKVLKAGRSMFSFEADLDDTRLHHDIMRESLSTNSSRRHVDTDDEDGRNDTPREIRIKGVDVTSQPSTSTLDEVEDLARKMHSLDIGDVAYSHYYTHLVYLAPAIARAWPIPRTRRLSQMPSPPTPRVTSHHKHTPNNLLCYFCGLAHLIHDCPTAAEYIRIGRVIQGNNCILFPNYSRIRRAENGTIQQAVDDYYGNSIPTPTSRQVG